MTRRHQSLLKIDEALCSLLQVAPMSKYKLLLKVQDRIAPELAIEFYRCYVKQMESDPDIIFPTLEEKLERGCLFLITRSLSYLQQKKRIEYVESQKLWQLTKSDCPVAAVP